MKLHLSADFEGRALALRIASGSPEPFVERWAAQATAAVLVSGNFSLFLIALA
jgi:hypothetical protein